MYLARYYLEYRDDGRVLYRGRYHPGLGRDHQLCCGLEFLAMLVPHVTLRHECRIHTYGAVSTRIRKELGWIRKDQEEPRGPDNVVVAEEEESGFVKLRRKSWARLIAKVYLENPALCSGCGEEMKIISALTSPDQDEVIEKILRHLNLRDPPWKRERRARGPPPELEAVPADDDFAEFSQLRPEGEDEFSQVPPDDDSFN